MNSFLIQLQSISPLLFPAIMLLIYWFAFYRRGKKFVQFVKYILAPATFVGGMASYYYGYSEGYLFHEPFANFLQAFFSASRLFVLENDISEIKEHASKSLLQWFAVINASAAVIFATLLINVFAKNFITWFKIKINQQDQLYVFFGVNEASITLASDIRKKTPSGLMLFIKNIDECENESYYEQAEELGAFLVGGDSFIDKLFVKNEDSIIHTNSEENSSKRRIVVRDNFLKRSYISRKVSKCRTHFLVLSENEDINIRIAHSVINELKKSKSLLEKEITFHILTFSEEMDDLFFESLEPSFHITISILNYPYLASRNLLAKYKPVEHISLDTKRGMATSDFTCAVIGLGQMGIAALKILLEQSQFVGSHFKAIAIDKEMSIIEGTFKNRYPGVTANYEIEFHESRVGSSTFFEIIKNQLNDLNCIVISLGSDALNIQTAFDIQQLVKRLSTSKIRILVQVKDNFAYDKLFLSNRMDLISVFGRNIKVFTDDIVIGEILEKQAKAVHDYYNAQNPPAQFRAWSNLLRIEQLSNLSVAEHIDKMLALMGLEKGDIEKFGSQDQFLNKLNADIIENLAKTEHLRWNAHHFLNGWNTLELSEIPENVSYNKIKERKLHACLVSWESLSLVNNRFPGKDFYRYDREIVLRTYDLVKNWI